MNIKEMIENCDYVIVPDTNIFLNIYKYSPEFADFAIERWRKVIDYSVVTATSDIEYRKHANRLYYNMKRRVEENKNSLIKQFDTSKDKIIKSFNNLEKLQYPEISNLKREIADKLNNIEKSIDDFFDERSCITLAADYWQNDCVEEIERKIHLLPELTQKELYEICQDGESRYKKEIPPGFKDAKGKDGIQKYSDLIIWKEIIAYSKDATKNIIFVTDDAKADWWKESQFHPDLISEFKKETGLDIIGFTSNDFYKEVSSSFCVRKSDIVDIVLNMTDDDYINNIQESVFDDVINDIVYSGESLLSFDNHVGTEGLNDIEILDYDFIRGFRAHRSDSGIIYNFIYDVTIEGNSTNYWGRDDDTKEVITSPKMYHKFKGEIKVEVTRFADLYVNFEDDTDYEKAKVISGSLEEIEFQDWQCDESEKDLGYGFCTRP